MSDNGDDDLEVVAKSQLWFKVDNQTGYSLDAQSCFADFGDFTEPPSSALPFTTSSGGHATSSGSPFAGTAGIVGYKIQGEQALYLRLLASKPYKSAKGNYATAAIQTEDKGIDQDNYNWLYSEPSDKTQFHVV